MQHPEQHPPVGEPLGLDGWSVEHDPVGVLDTHATTVHPTADDRRTLTRSVRTFCRICEVHCGLVVDVEPDPATGAERVIKVSPDRDHPVSKGYCCVKGLGLGALHHDPDRVDRPLKRVDGELVEIGWDQALAEIGARVRGLVDEHGPRRWRSTRATRRSSPCRAP